MRERSDYSHYANQISRRMMAEKSCRHPRIEKERNCLVRASQARYRTAFLLVTIHQDTRTDTRRVLSSFHNPGETREREKVESGMAITSLQHDSPFRLSQGSVVILVQLDISLFCCFIQRVTRTNRYETFLEMKEKALVS